MPSTAPYRAFCGNTAYMPYVCPHSAQYPILQSTVWSQTFAMSFSQPSREDINHSDKDKSRSDVVIPSTSQSQSALLEREIPVSYGSFEKLSRKSTNGRNEPNRINGRGKRITPSNNHSGTTLPRYTSTICSGALVILPMPERSL